jgi:hypothetical protein
MTKEAIEYYETLINKEDPSQIEELSTKLQMEMRAEKAMFGDRILCPFLRPHFITLEQYQQIQKVVGTLMRAVDKLYQAALRTKRLRQQLGLTPSEERLMKIDPGFKGFSVTSRIDSFLSEGALQFVELNAETPAGIAYQDVLSQIFAKLPLMKQFSKKYKVHSVGIRAELAKLLQDIYREFCKNTGRPKKEFPNIAIVDWLDVPTRFEFELFQEFFEKNGFKAIITDPRHLDHIGHKLRSGDFEIDLIYRRVLTSEFLERLDLDHPMIQAYENQDVCIVNPFRTKFAHKKMIFGLLSDEKNEKYFSQREKAVIDRHVPWTRRVRQGYTRYKGKKVDLCQFILDNKDTLVMKPNDEYGGKGIYIGWESSRADWAAALTHALAEDYVVQEKVQVARERFPVITNGSVSYDEFIVDMDPYIFHGKYVHGCLTRLSGTALCNVTSGGGQTPTFIIEKRRR